MHVVNQPYIKNANKKSAINFSADSIVMADGKTVQQTIEDMQAQIDSMSTLVNKLSQRPPTVYKIPTAKNLVFDSLEQVQTFTDYDSTAMDISGDLKATDAGTYTTVFTLKDQTFSKWSDETTEPKSVVWTIEKADAELTAMPDSISFSSASASQTITFSKKSDAELVITNSAPTVVTTEQSGNVLTVTSIGEGSSTITGALPATINYNESSVFIPIICSYMKRIGLAWDGANFYRVDKDMNVISDSNFDPSTTFPYNEMIARANGTKDGVFWPKMYGTAEKREELGPYGVVWWIDSTKTNDNEVFPSFVEDGAEKNGLWISSALESNTTYNNLCTKTKNTVFNVYDYYLMLKLTLIEYSPGSTNINNKLASGMSWRLLNKAFDTAWIFGMDMLKKGTESATAGSGKLRILDPAMNGTFIDTKIAATENNIRGAFSIDNINGVDMSNLLLDVSESQDGWCDATPYAFQNFCNDGGGAFTVSRDFGFLGFDWVYPTDKTAWRKRKLL